MSTNSFAFRQFLQKVSQCSTIKQAISEAEINYNIKAYHIEQITPEEAAKFYDAIYTKFYKGHNHCQSSGWFENELRLFVWIVVFYTHLKAMRIQQLDQQDWQYFSHIFDRKDPKLFEYQCHCLYLEKKSKNWQEHEENLLKLIIEKSSPQGKVNTCKIKWNEISKSLFQVSNKKYLRTPKQCRERWNNHLDPSKIKGMWRREECLLMFEYVLQKGKKWANIVKILGNVRNQHSIKNKFNSLLKKQTKSRKDISEKQMYLEIISRIKSAIANEKYSRKPNTDGFDLDDGQQAIPAVENKNVSNFAQKMMMKLMNFGKTTETSISQRAFPSTQILKENMKKNYEKSVSEGENEQKLELGQSQYKKQELSQEQEEQDAYSSLEEEISEIKQEFNNQFMKGENDLKLSCSFEEGFQGDKFEDILSLDKQKI